jgi:ferrous iron transport protein B
VGNPNTGKSTLINALSGADLQVGNWSGTTVERMEAHFSCGGRRVTLVDLPGTYSLSATTPEEALARRELLEQRPDVVLDVVDAGNLERNLYLTLELTELGHPLVVVLNLVDEAAEKGITLDAAALERELGVPVVATVASRGQGLAEVAARALHPALPGPQVSYPPLIEEAVGELARSLEVPHRRWLALAALAEEEVEVPEAARPVLEKWRHRLREAGVDAFLEIAEARYRRARDLARAAAGEARGGHGLTERLDSLVLHPVLGVPVFLAGFFVVFRFTYLFSDPWVEFAGAVQEVLAGWIGALGLPRLVRSFLAEGLVGGLGTVLAFTPVLFFLYLALSFLESSGFLARMAFLADRVMKSVGLPGRGFLPLLLGFGCNVPALYATRTLEGFHDRLRVAMAIPFMACSARMTVFALFAAVFFPRQADLVVFGLYLGGLSLGLLTAMLLSHLTPPSVTSGVMELPPYRMPTAAVLLRLARLRTMDFVRGAGGVILAAVLVVWLLLNVPPGDLSQSLYGRLAGALGFLFRPLGIEDWRLVGALVPGFVAKEVVVGTLGVSYLGSQAGTALGLNEGLQALGQALVAALQGTLNAFPAMVGLPQLVSAPPEVPGGLPGALSASVSPAGALAYMTFVLLYTPCVATMAAQAREFGRRWAAASAAWQLTLAWLAGLLVYQVGSRL